VSDDLRPSTPQITVPPTIVPQRLPRLSICSACALFKRVKSDPITTASCGSFNRATHRPSSTRRRRSLTDPLAVITTSGARPHQLLASPTYHRDTVKPCAASRQSLKRGHRP
jgi:hypothetical protein